MPKLTVKSLRAAAATRKGRRAARGSAIRDEFRGDNVLLRDCIKALINLNDENALVPHGIGGHARNLLAACYHRLPNAEAERPAGRKHCDSQQPIKEQNANQ